MDPKENETSERGREKRAARNNGKERREGREKRE